MSSHKNKFHNQLCLYTHVVENGIKKTERKKTEKKHRRKKRRTLKMAKKKCRTQKKPKKIQKKRRKEKMPNDSLTERKNVENVNLYILKHLDVNHFIDMSMKKICE